MARRIEPPVPRASLPRSLALLSALIFLAVLLRTAWISDDALISLRSLLNVTHGFGLTFNIAERVQTFTHPLWLALVAVAYLVIGNVYYALFALSFTVSVAVFWIAVRKAATTAQAVLVIIVLLFSRAFIDFSTSGLENPLSHLLLAGFLLVALRPRPNGQARLQGLWFLGSLMYLARPDLVLLAAPVLIVTTLRAARNRATMRDLAVGLSPAVAWTLFALIYYGFPFPNTAYAKLTMGIHDTEVWRQGLLYLLDSLDRDPLTFTTIAFGVLLGLGTRGPARGLAVGVVLYLIYVASIGGDFMAGRFMTAPLFAAVLILGWLGAAEPRTWWAAAGMLGVIGLASAQVPLLSDSRFEQTASKDSGTVDERAMYFGIRSLVRADRQTFQNPAWPSAADAPPDIRVVETCGLMGEAGLEYGPHTYLLDECGLADPLLARLPAEFNHNWRVGHYRRRIPAGYRESVDTNSNQLRDAGLRRYYDQLSVLTRSERLFSTRRLNVIWRMNVGAYEDWIDWRFYRHGGALVPLEAVSGIVEDQTPYDEPGVYDLTRPLTITVDDLPGRRYLDITLDSDDRYLLLFLKANRIMTMMELGPIPEHRRYGGLATYTEDLPLAATQEGFDMVIVAPVFGDDRYAMGHLLLDGWEATDAELRRRVIERDQSTPR